ncbi:hypothetical protein HJC10_46660, partial [Corallococcus exiguus]|nr:hypothetical protein [Corallococcus exiguus]
MGREFRIRRQPKPSCILECLTNRLTMSGTSGSSLSLRFLLKDAASTTGLAAAATRLSGLTPAAKALAVAAAAQNAPAVVIVPADKDIEPFVSDARFFLGSLEGLSGAALERGVLSLPSPE